MSTARLGVLWRRRQEIRAEPVVPNGNYMDELGRLREEGCALRRAIELPPMGHPTRGLKETMLGGPVLVAYEDKAEAWVRRVRAVVVCHAPCFLGQFDQGAGLPRRDPLILMTPRGTRAQLMDFLDMRCQQLDRIMLDLFAKGR